MNSWPVINTWHWPRDRTTSSGLDEYSIDDHHEHFSLCKALDPPRFLSHKKTSTIDRKSLLKKDAWTQSNQIRLTYLFGGFWSFWACKSMLRTPHAPLFSSFFSSTIRSRISFNQAACPPKERASEGTTKTGTMKNQCDCWRKRTEDYSLNQILP